MTRGPVTRKPLYHRHPSTNQAERPNQCRKDTMTKTSKTPRPPLTGGFMSDKPLSFPLVGPSSVSKDARVLHRHAASGSGQHLDRDIFDPKTRHRFIPREEAESFTPTDRMMAAIAELQAVGLANYEPKFRALYTSRVHKLYTYARGRGSQIITVKLFDQDEMDSQLLAVLIGADLESRDRRGGQQGDEIAVRARHETATDFEHDASSTALLVVRNPSPPVFTGYGRMTFTGVLTEARLYGIGVDPLQVSDRDTETGHMCHRCDDHHPFAPYQPPLVEELRIPRFVTVETLPFQAYQVDDIFSTGAAITHMTESETA